jgi:menaquinone-dependent protoporphyrinogen IX oxidase
MEKTNDNLRERILSHLPQPENLAAYREETASLLTKHEKALFWERMPSIVCFVSAIAILIANWFWAHKIGAALNQTAWFGVGILIFAGTVLDLRYQFYRNKVDLLKEIKQVQLQILEFQASMEKSGNARGL